MVREGLYERNNVFRQMLTQIYPYPTVFHTSVFWVHRKKRVIGRQAH